MNKKIKPSYHDLVDEFLTYLQCFAKFKNTGILDLESIKFVYPTTILPLIKIIKEQPHNYKPPKEYPPQNWIDTMLTSSGGNYNNTYFPPVSLPQTIDYSLADKMYMIRNNENDFGGIDAFQYTVNELIANIYDHSQFTSAWMMGQRYPTKGFVDLTFYDEGITIPETFKNNGQQLDDITAINYALSGKSTKHDNGGYGLSTSIKIFLDGLHADFFIASGNGAILIDQKKTTAYTLSIKFAGTLLTARIPEGQDKIDIYRYV